MLVPIFLACSAAAEAIDPIGGGHALVAGHACNKDQDNDQEKNRFGAHSTNSPNK